MELPEKPLDSDCCGSGCTPCVFDVYEQLLNTWKVSKTSNTSTKVLRTDLLSVLKYKPYKLRKIEKVTESTNIYTFFPFVSLNQKLHSSEEDKQQQAEVNEVEGILPYDVGQHFVLINSKPDKDTGKKSICRSYTPITLAEYEPNCGVKFLIKLYEDGAMSAYISRLSINQVMYMRGGFGEFHHRPNSTYIFICAGTGIAPIYAIVKSILQDETDDTTMRLLFTCRAVKDIYFRDEIRQFGRFWNFSSRIYVTGEEIGASRVKHDENVQFGRISKDVVCNEVSRLSSNLNYKVLICGSSSFNDDMTSYADQNGVSKDNLFVF